MNAKRPEAKVFVLYTGGTIGMRPIDPENPASPLVPASKEDLEKYVPGLGEAEGIHWEIHPLVDLNGKEVPPVDSSEVNANHWCYMAGCIEDAYDDFDGFVILHGTDTMAYTASALSFLLSNLAKPVVVTGSQLPISHVRTDAVQNFVNSVHIAGYKATGLPLVPEVTICFADSLLRGNRVRKVSTSAWQGFDTPNYPKLGAIGEYIKINEDVVRPPADNNDSPFFALKELVTNVMDLGIFPGLKASELEAILGLDVRGFVFRTFGAGNAPSDPDFLDAIAKAVTGIGERGKVILNVTQCNQGMVEMGLYAASSGLLERKVISGLDMTPEAALTKMMWLLTTETGEEIGLQLQIDQRGEQSESLFDVRFGEAGKKSQPMDVVKATARPSGQFRKDRLNRAVLRVSGLGFADAKKDEDIELKVFINMPGATATTSENDPHFAVNFRQPYQGADDTVLIQDVTPTVKRVVEEGRPINVTLIPGGGKKIWYNGLYLALFGRA